VDGDGRHGSVTASRRSTQFVDVSAQCTHYAGMTAGGYDPDFDLDLESDREATSSAFVDLDAMRQSSDGTGQAETGAKTRGRCMCQT